MTGDSNLVVEEVAELPPRHSLLHPVHLLHTSRVIIINVVVITAVIILIVITINIPQLLAVLEEDGTEVEEDDYFQVRSHF